MEPSENNSINFVAEKGAMQMENLFQWINSVLKFVGPLSDFFWDVPTMFHAYKSLPILGSFSLAIVLLMGSGIYFTLRLGFIQVKACRAPFASWRIIKPIWVFLLLLPLC